MPELQSDPVPPQNVPLLLDAAALTDADFALGCECADPALQIERWTQECAAPAADAH